MSSRTLLNLGLAALVVVLVLVVIYRPGIEPEPAPLRLTTALEPATAVSITVSRELRPPLTLARQGDDWFVFTGEQEVPAAAFQVNALLRLLTATAGQHYAVDAVDLAALGLEPPQAMVTIDDLEFRFGSQTAARCSEHDAAESGRRRHAQKGYQSNTKCLPHHRDPLT